MDWQPIETAPKDGTSVIMAGFDVWGLDWLNVAFFEDGQWQHETGSEWGICPATHWMPLPEPPNG